MVKTLPFRFVNTLSKPGLWLIVVLLALITLPHYQELFEDPYFIAYIFTNTGLDRHTFERILYLVPIVWAGFIFGWRGAVITSTAALFCMLPRAIIVSPFETDALFESGAVFVIGNVLAVSFEALRRERVPQPA